MKRIISTLLAVFGLSFMAIGQNFPVDLNLQVLPPYSPAFHTFGQSQAVQSNKIMLSATLKDLVRPSLDIGLQFEFRGPNGVHKSDPALIFNPIAIQQGMPTLLSNIDLNPYFLTPGLAERVTNSDGFMPEGDWEVCVTAYELLNQEQVSRTTCFYLFLEEYDPPEILLPEDSLLPQFPQNIQLMWQPLHIGAFPVRYDVEIWETLDGFTDQQLVESTFPYYAKTVSNITTEFYTVSDPPLMVGEEYLMRVRVKDNVNGEMGPPVYAFKNQGYSNLHRFKYGMVLDGEECVNPGQPDYVTDDSLNMYIFWDDGEPPLYTYDAPEDGGGNTLQNTGLSSQNQSTVSGVDEGPSGLGGLGGGSLPGSLGSSLGSSTGPAYNGFYKVYYRDVTDGVEGEWSIYETTNKWVAFEDYTRGREYEIYVAYVCSSEERQSESIFVSFSTLPPERPYSCGMPQLPVNLDNERPLVRLEEGDTIIAGDFRVVILDVEGSNGNFSGSGYVKMGMIPARVGLVFHNVYINNEYRMVDGSMKTMYDPTGSNIFDPGVWKDIFVQDEDPFPVISMTKVDDVEFIDGKVVIYPGGQEYDPPLRVQTPEGDIIISGGMIVRQVDFSEPAEVAAGYEVDFSVDDSHRYGFDPYDQKLTRSYEDLGGVFLDNKSVARGGSDQIVAQLVKKSAGWSEASWDSVQVVTENRFELPYKRLGEDGLLIKLPGLEGDELVYVMKDEECLGAFVLYPYTIVDYVVNLIPVNGEGANVDFESIESSVNKMLRQGVVNVDLRFLSEEGVTDDSGEIETDSDVLEAYTDQMRGILQQHRSEHEVRENEMYLFLVDEISGDVNGVMPKGLSAGFVEASGSAANLARLIAHELGHGAFTLKHFWEESDYQQGRSKNLMDYGDGGDLVLKQWNRMHNQRFPLPWFQGDAEGQNYVWKGYFNRLDFGANKDGTFSFVTPSGDYIVLPDTVKNIVMSYGFDFSPQADREEYQKFLKIPPGTLKSFEVGGRKYDRKLKFDGSGLMLEGYFWNGLEYDPTDYSKMEEGVVRNDSLILSSFTFNESKKVPEYNLYTVTNSNIPYFDGPSVIGELSDFKITNPQTIYREKKIAKPEYKMYDPSAMSEETLNWTFNEDTYDRQGLTSLYLNKIAELKGIYPRFIEEKVTNNFGRWSDEVCKSISPHKFEKQLKQRFCVKDGTSPQGPVIYKYNDLLIFPSREELYREFLDSLSFYLEEFRNEQADLYQELLVYDFQKDTIGDLTAVGINELVNGVSEDDIKALDFNVKIKLISKLVSQFFVPESTSLSASDTEGSILKLLRNIDQSRSCDLIDELQKSYAYSNNDEWLLYRLFSKLDDKFFSGGDNRLRLVESVTGRFMSCGTEYQSALIKAMADIDNRIFVFDYDPVVLRLIKSVTFYNVGALLSDNVFDTQLTTVKIDHEFMDDTSNKNKIKIQRQGEFGMLDYNTGDPSFFDPFELVYLVDQSNFTRVGKLTSIEQDNVTVNDVPVPAITLAYASNVAGIQTTREVVETTVDLAGLVFSGGALTVANNLNKLRKIIYTADVISSFTGIISTGLSSNDEFREVNTFLSLISAGTGLISAGDIFINAKKVVGEGSEITEQLDNTFEAVKNLDNAAAYKGLEELAESGGEPEAIFAVILEKMKKAKLDGDEAEVARIEKVFQRYADLNTVNKSGEKLFDDIISLSEDQMDFATTALAKLDREYSDIIVHGNGTDFIYNGRTVSHRTMARIIEQENLTKPIRLLSCSSESSAIDLANKLGRDVLAYVGETRIYENGRIAAVNEAGELAPAFRYSPGGGKEDVQFADQAEDLAGTFLELGANSRIVGSISDLASDIIKRFKDLGLTDSQIGALYQSLARSDIELEKILDIFEAANQTPENLTKLVLDLTKSEGKTLLRKLVDGGKEGGVGLIRAHEDFIQAGRNYSAVNPEALDNYLKLNQTNRELILKFSDNAPNSTLVSFLKDCDDLEFMAFLNKVENENIVKSFVSHKEGIDLENITDEIAEKLLNDLKDLPGETGIKTRKWFERSAKIASNNTIFSKARKFERFDPDVPNSGVARDEFMFSSGLNPNQVVDQVTLIVNGKRIRIDYLGKGIDNKFHLGDAKFSTSNKNWQNDWISASTTNQKAAFPDIISKNNDILIRATDPDKISAIELNLGIKLTNGEYIIKANDLSSFKIIGSEADDYTKVNNVVELID